MFGLAMRTDKGPGGGSEPEHCYLESGRERSTCALQFNSEQDQCQYRIR